MGPNVREPPSRLMNRDLERFQVDNLVFEVSFAQINLAAADLPDAPSRTSRSPRACETSPHRVLTTQALAHTYTLKLSVVVLRVSPTRRLRVRPSPAALTHRNGVSGLIGKEGRRVCREEGLTDQTGNERGG